jgi:predicted metal-dependent phosphoesterase TrpH
VNLEILLTKIDLHVHSVYSIDSTITPEQLVVYARKRGLDGVAVTDHDRLDSGLKISKEVNFLVLPGMEVSSRDGHIIGLNINTPVAKGLPAEETVNKIHAAGGIAIACHPSAFLKESLNKHVTAKFDAVEVINSSSIPFRYSLKRNEKLASRLDVARVAGSDAHYGPEIGCAYTLIDGAPNMEDIAEAIKKKRCQPFGNGIPVTTRLKRILSTVRKRSSI